MLTWGLGLWNVENLANALGAVSLAVLTRPRSEKGLGWSRDEVEVFLADVRKDLKNTDIHAYFPMLVERPPSQRSHGSNAVPQSCGLRAKARVAESPGDGAACWIGADARAEGEIKLTDTQGRWPGL